MRKLFLGVMVMVIGFGLLASCTAATDKPVLTKQGPWTLAADQSGMTYVTIKNNLLGEINTFRDISGIVSEGGHAQINIDLNSVDTNNEIRDGRMIEFLFKADTYPIAKITTKLDMEPYESVAIGESRTELLELMIDLHGVELDYDAYVLVTRLGPNKVVVATKAPMLLDASDFGLEDGLAKLQELASLDGITPIAPVTVSFVFER